MKSLFDAISYKTSKNMTQAYSTSFSLGIYCLSRKMHQAIYGIYGYVRLADEIVDSFHNYPKAEMLEELKKETALALERRISLNPILNSFQNAVHQYHINHELIHAFMKSMEIDLHPDKIFDSDGYNEYIYGSAEVVGLMCLKVFVEENDELYERLKPFARQLGAAFQKVNFLRDAKEDYHILGRTYFPKVNFNSFSQHDKEMIEQDIEQNFEEAYKGIKQLPLSSRYGVYMAYIYYLQLFKKIKKKSAKKIFEERIRIPNSQKFFLLFKSYIQFKLNAI